jgi:hypothetical protein
MRRWIVLASSILLTSSALSCATGRRSGAPGWSDAVRQSSLLTWAEGESARGRKIFTSDEPLVLTIAADFDQLLDDREEESEERPGRMTLVSSDGDTSFPIEVKTRGNFRLQSRICPFPPLRLDFPMDSVQGTALEGQDRVKLVTHCRDRDSYEQNVLEEYLAYRIYNLLTDISFRVQLALITYRDTSGTMTPISRLGFLIEDEDALAARLGGEMLEVPAADPASFVQEQVGLLYLFEFMIGNTDWSAMAFHNVKLLRVEWEYMPIPYDFDFSGFVDAPYAGPNPILAGRISSVRERLFWGICSDHIDYPSLFARFNELHDEILSLVQTQPGLTERNARSGIDYLDGFYRIINDERASDRRIMRACRQLQRQEPPVEKAPSPPGGAGGRGAPGEIPSTPTLSADCSRTSFFLPERGGNPYP